MKKRFLKNWKRHLSLIISLVMIVTACNTYPVQAASNVYSNDFEKTVGTFHSFRDAKVQLSNVSGETDQSSKEEEASDEAVLTKKVTMKLEDGGWTDGFVELKALLSKTSKEGISSYESIKVVVSVDKVETFADAAAQATLFFQPNTTWNWCTGETVDVTAGKDITLTIPTASINWGAGDTEVGNFGIQFVNFKEGMDVNVSVKSIEMVNKNKTSSLAAAVKTGEANIKYEAQYDITKADIDLTPFLSVVTKDDISDATSIEAVINVDQAESFTAEKTPVALMFFMPNKTWQWATGETVAVTAGQDIKVSIPTTSIKWGDGDTSVGACGLQICNFKEGTVNYTIKSVKVITESEDKDPVKVSETATELGAAKSGNSFLSVSERKNALSGAYVDLTDSLKAGKTYKVSAWVKNIGSETDFIKLSWDKNSVSNGTIIAATKAVKGEWVQLEAVLSVPKTAKKVVLKFTSVNTKNDFGIDDVVVTQESQGTTSIISNDTVTDKDVVNGTVTIENKTFNNLTIDASVGSAAVVLNNVTVIGKLSYISGGAAKIELNDTVVNEFYTVEGKIDSKAIQSFAVTENMPTIVLGPGSSLVRFLAGGNVELTQDEKSVLENIVVKPGVNGALQITLKNVKCNLVVEADSASPINIVLENAQLNDVTVNSLTAGGQVDFTGDTSSNIAALNMDDSEGITSTIQAPVQNLHIAADNATVNVGANIGAIVMSGNQGSINVGEKVSVGTLKTSGDYAKISSQGSISSLLINGDYATATVTSATKVEIKKGTTGAEVKGSSEVVNNNPSTEIYWPTPSPTPVVTKATTNKVLLTNSNKSLKAVQDKVYPDAGVLLDISSYFGDNLIKSQIDRYERIEIKLTVDNVTNYSETNQGKVTVYTMNTNWNWTEYSQPTLTSNKEITITLNTSAINFDGDSKLNVIGLKFSQFAPDTAFNCNIASIKLIAGDGASDGQQDPKATEDLVISSTAHTGSSAITDQGWSGVGDIDITSYLTETSKLKSTASLYDYLEVKLSFSSGTAFTNKKPQAKIYTQDSVNWKWADGGDTAVVENGTTTVRLPISKIAWGEDGKSTTLAKAGLQIYDYAAGQTINYTIESIKLIAPSTTSPTTPEITGDYVEVVKTEYNVSGTLDLKSKFDVTKANINKYEKIKVVLDINKVALKGTATGIAKIFSQDDKTWSWAEGNTVDVAADTTLTLELPTSAIKWGSDGKSTTLGALGIQFFGAEAGTKIGYKIVSAELTGLKVVDPTPVDPTPVEPTPVAGDLTVISSVSGSALQPDYIADFTSKSVVTKDALSKYSSIEVKLTVHSLTPKENENPGVQIYMMTNKWKWNSMGGVSAVSGSSLTLTVPISSIVWDGADDTSLNQIGIQFYGTASVSYTIESYKLIAPVVKSQELTVVSSVSGSALQPDYISDFTSKSVITKEALSKYTTIEVKLTINSLTPDVNPGVQIYMMTDKWKWTSKGGINAVAGQSITLTMSVSDIDWSGDSTALGQIGIQFYGTKDVSYSIESIILKK